MQQEIKGYIHVHSNYSFDGKNSVKELAEFFAAKGYEFVCLTEHADDFDDFKMASLVNDCKKYSDKYITVVPGLEYRCNDLVHLLGIGVTELCGSDDPIEVSRHIKQNGGVAIVAHPRGYEKNLTPTLINVIDGLEIWSGPKDSRFFPHWESLLTFKNLKRIYPSLIGLGGADLHTIEAYFPLDTIIKTNSEAFSSSGFSNGVLSIKGAYWNLLPGSISSFQRELTLKVLRIALNMAKRFMHRI